MHDRTPTYRGRVQLTPVPGQENVFDMVRADEPENEGTPLNKATFLQDKTAALYGLGTDAVPDDAFKILSDAAFAQTENIYKGEERSAVSYVGTNVCAVFDGGKFLLLGTDKGARISTDGINWTSHTTDLTAVPNSGSLAFGSGKFVVGLQTNPPGIAYSENGLNWTTADISGLGLPNSSKVYGLKYIQGRFIGVVNNSTYGVYSADGVNWTTMNLGHSGSWVDVAYGNGVYVAIDDEENTYALSTSSDGINWAYKTSAMGNPSPKSKIIFANGKFVISCKTRSEVLDTIFSYSEDGETWLQSNVEATSANKSYYAVGWTGKEFISFGSKGAIVTSPDGVTWTKITSPTNWPSGASQQAAFGNGVFVAPSAGGAYVYVQKSLYQSETVLTDIAKNPLSILAGQIVGGTKIATGSYKGTGKYGSASPNSITLDFEPYMVIILSSITNYSQVCPAFYVWGADNMGVQSATVKSTGSGSFANNFGNKVTVSGTTMSWYVGSSSGYAAMQLNESGITYHYLAIG